MASKHVTSTKARRTLTRRLFVAAYVKSGGNGAQAALAVGLGKNSKAAAVFASKMLAEPETKVAIERMMATVDASAERIVEELSRIAFQDARMVQDVVTAFLSGDVDGLDDVAAAVVSGVKVTRRVEGTGKRKSVVEDVEVKTWDKNSALRTLAMIKKMMGVRVEHTGAGGGPIEHAVTFYLPRSPHELPEAAVVEAELVPEEEEVLPCPTDSPQS